MQKIKSLDRGSRNGLILSGSQEGEKAKCIASCGLHSGRNQYISISFISFSDEAVVFMVVTSVGSKDI